MMLFCIPLFAFILKILYLRQKRFYIEHLVYALNIHAFFYLAAILVVLISIGLNRWIPGTPQVLLTLLLCLLVFVQIFLSIRRVYRQGWFMTMFKFAFGGLIYLFVIALAVGATAFVTLAAAATGAARLKTAVKPPLTRSETAATMKAAHAPAPAPRRFSSHLFPRLARPPAVRRLCRPR